MVLASNPNKYFLRKERFTQEKNRALGKFTILSFLEKIPHLNTRYFLKAQWSNLCERKRKYLDRE